MEPDALAQVLCQLPEFYDTHLLVGFETSDDAAVYQISDSHAMIQTVDIFPPIVDDPFLYGQIAAANSLRDVYKRQVYMTGRSDNEILHSFCVLFSSRKISASFRATHGISSSDIVLTSRINLSL